MVCKCVDEINSMLEPKNGRLAFGFSIVRSEGMIGGIRHAPIMIEVEKIASRGKRPPIVLATFCPFCGTKLENDEKETVATAT